MRKAITWWSPFEAWRKCSGIKDFTFITLTTQLLALPRSGDPLDELLQCLNSSLSPCWFGTVKGTTVLTCVPFYYTFSSSEAPIIREKLMFTQIFFLGSFRLVIGISRCNTKPQLSTWLLRWVNLSSISWSRYIQSYTYVTYTYIQAYMYMYMSITHTYIHEIFLRHTPLHTCRTYTDVRTHIQEIQDWDHTFPYLCISSFHSVILGLSFGGGRLVTVMLP